MKEDRQGDTPLLIVTDPYEPFIFPPGAELKGLDYDVTEAVFQMLKIPIEIKFYPFKRCLNTVKAKKADALIDLAITEERHTLCSFLMNRCQTVL
ncbi:MAG: amino acid ABC transporter substrate-binding protein [Desulfobacteraceae bacterium]|nr:amino acid ABC transporter substrate-binding protein [Desulfobacteraceae bacterium]